MKNKTDLESITKLSDEELLRRLSELLSQSRRVESELVAHIGEVDARRLYADRASSSMFVYCVEVLHLSEAEAYLRINVARASRRHPVLLEMLADGRLHLSGIAKLAQHLTEDNRDALLARAVGKAKRQIDELVAELSPKPDVAATVRKLPERGTKKELKTASRRLCPDRVAPSSEPMQYQPEAETAIATPPTTTSGKPAEAEPIAKARYKVAFTASAELRDKLERLRALTGGDLATIIDEAVTEKLERLEAKRFGTTKAPRKSVEESDTSPSSRYIPAPVRRAVYARDQGRCTYVGATGRRCSERNRLEFHHDRQPYGRGGDHQPSNIRLMCRVHNTVMAERDYGKEVMGRYRKAGSLPNRVSEPGPVYIFTNRATPAPFPPPEPSLPAEYVYAVKRQLDHVAEGYLGGIVRHVTSGTGFLTFRMLLNEVAAQSSRSLTVPAIHELTLEKIS